jgi:hypothetical protein
MSPPFAHGARAGKPHQALLSEPSDGFRSRVVARGHTPDVPQLGIRSFRQRRLHDFDWPMSYEFVLVNRQCC